MQPELPTVVAVGALATVLMRPDEPRHLCDMGDLVGAVHISNPSDFEVGVAPTAHGKYRERRESGATPWVNLVRDPDHFIRLRALPGWCPWGTECPSECSRAPGAASRSARGRSQTRRAAACRIGTPPGSR